MDTTLFCTKCKKADIDESDTCPNGDIAEDIVHLDCGGVIEEVCSYCLGEGTVVVDEPVYANEPWITAPIGERECICRKQARADRDADDAWKERE